MPQQRCNTSQWYHHIYMVAMSLCGDLEDEKKMRQSDMAEISHHIHLYIDTFCIFHTTICITRMSHHYRCISAY